MDNTGEPKYDYVKADVQWVAKHGESSSQPGGDVIYFKDDHEIKRKTFTSIAGQNCLRGPKENKGTPGETDIVNNPWWYQKNNASPNVVYLTGFDEDEKCHKCPSRSVCDLPRSAEEQLLFEQFYTNLEAATLNPTAALAKVNSFYDLDVGLDPEHQDAHLRIALELGRSLDATTLNRLNVMQRLQRGEKIQIIQVPAMRAGESLVDVDPETNLLKQLETATNGQFSVTYLPIGVTRHRETEADLQFHQYYPNPEELADIIDPEATAMVIIQDFGSATGLTGAKTAQTLIDKLKVNTAQVFINTVVASDDAQTACRDVLPQENITRLVKAGRGGGDQQNWLVSIGQETDESLEPLAGPKDWGAVIFGQEPKMRGIYKFDETDEEFLGLYIEHTKRLLDRHYQILLLNNDPESIQRFEAAGKAELLAWYNQRYLGTAGFDQGLRDRAHIELIAYTPADLLS